MEEMDSAKGDSVSKEIENRKKNLVKFFKEKTDWIVYGILTLIIAVSVYIRTLPMKINPATGKPGLWDIGANNWTLGPDLDPFLFLRWAKYIAEHGKLFLLDTMRYIPTAQICTGSACDPVNPSQQSILLPTMISWLYQIIHSFNSQLNVTYAAIIFPVVMSVFTAIAFFLFARKIFYREDKKAANIIALISTAFFVLIPSLLPRAIAGIPEKESAGFAFIFLSFYFFLEAFTSEKMKNAVIFGVLAGISTAILGMVWGGATLVFVVIAGAVFIEFMLGKMDEKKVYAFSLWIASFTLLLAPISLNYTLADLMESSSTALCFVLFFILLIDMIVFKKKILKLDEKLKKIKIPHQIISIILGGIILMIIATLVFGISFIPNIVKDIISSTIHPIVWGRFSMTVAENAQPYFINDWTNNFGPVVFNTPLYFWLFFTGSALFFYHTVKSFERKEKKILITGYVLFLISLIFSKYSSGSILNGNSGLSLIMYFGGALLFMGCLGYVYYKKYKEDKFSGFSELNFSYIFYLISLILMIIAARGAVRLVMVLGAVSPIAVGFLIMRITKKYFKEKDDFKKLISGILVLLILASSIFTIWVYYQSDVNMAENYIPGLYQWQWQNAMKWVRENTPENAVFAHWWDYGYWLQSIGERATVLDGGNAIIYWDHFMGRNVLTGTNERDSLDFLYAHNTTNLLIDSTDIGKYGAFSSIGSNGSYDRYSWIPTIFLDNSQTRETNNETVYVYPVGTAIDEDFVFDNNGKEVFLPRGKAIVIAITVKEDKDKKVLQPQIFFGYNNQQYSMPLRYVYLDGKKYNFNSGYEGGIYIFPMAKQESGKINVDQKGAAFYLSTRTVNSELAKLYLFNEKSDYFNLVHTEGNYITDTFKNQGVKMSDFIYYQGLQGPIKIWSVSYPGDIKLIPKYLETVIPAELDTPLPEGY